MHELPYLESILRTALTYSQKYDRAVTTVHITIDESIGFIDETADYYWISLIKAYPRLARATLSIKRIRTPKQCYGCERVYPELETDTACPACGSYRIGWSRHPQCEITAIDLHQ